MADSSIIGSVADSTLFIVRAGLFPLEMTDVLEKYYADNKFPNMSVILNGTIYDGKGVNSYRKGYGSSYGYGYTYGSDE